MQKIINLVGIFLVFLLVSCATYSPNYSDDAVKYEKNNTNNNVENRELETSFYLIGDAGNARQDSSTNALTALERHLDNKTTKGDYTIFLGDNVYDKGLPSKNDEKREISEHRLDVQIDAVDNFDGKVVFIPGNHDWYGDGLKGLKRQEEYVEKKLKDKKSFKPSNGCPIEKINVSENIILLTLDTQWYLSDWDKHPTINDECEIKSRNDFFLEIEGELKKK